MKVMIKVLRAMGRFIKLSPRRGSRPHLLLAALLAVTFSSLTMADRSSPSWADIPAVSSRYIIQDGTGVGSSPASDLVSSVGGQVQRDLGPISAVSASLTPSEFSYIDALPGVNVTPDVSVTVQATTTTPATGPVNVFTQQTGATSLWTKGDEGAGVNVAVLDTGIDPLPDFSGRLIAGVDLSGEGNALQDSYGHGTFVAGLIAGNGASSGGTYTGEAPQAGLVSVKVAGASGTTDLATVIAGVDWTIQNAQSLGIRVLNMSLGFVPFESTTINPLDQAVEQAWNSGVVVVASAGNAGPFNGTILSPGDDPLIITAGAVADNGSLSAVGDTMSSFSSVGPTYPDGWMKPDLVTSGRSVISLRAPGSNVDVNNPTAEVGTANFVGSGTSFSAAITSGAAALILSAHPSDTPNQVKAAMLATTSSGPVGNPFVDGHGVLNVAAAAGNNGAQLTQNFGDVLLEGAMDGRLQINTGDTIEAGYGFSMPGNHKAATVQMLAAEAALPVSCSQYGNGGIAGWITINLVSGPYSVSASANGWMPGINQNDPNSFQGTTTAPNLCNGAPMYNVGAGFSTQVNSTDTTDNVSVQFHYGDANGRGTAGWSPTQTVIPVTTTAVGTTVNLATTWAMSSWNPANWKGVSVLQMTSPAVIASLTGTGLLWNGSAWNGSAWNGSAWNGSAWNGNGWNGSAWNGSAWNGSAWNGSAWNGSAWNGSAWNGSAWN